MQLRHQRLLYLSFIGIFVVVVPITLLYTAGFRYNFGRNRVERTGVLVVESTPSRADVLINQQRVGTTPARLTALRPDTYVVGITKPDFFSWQKTLDVTSGETTFAQAIVLFRKSTPVLKIPGNVVVFAPDQAGEKIIYAIGTTTSVAFHMFDLTTDTDIPFSTPSPVPTGVQFAGWSAQRTYGLLQARHATSTTWYIADTASRTLRLVPSNPAAEFQQMRWDQETDGLLYGLNEQALVQVNIASGSTRPVLSTPMLDFIVSGPDIYFLSQQGTITLLQHQSTLTSAPTPQQIKLPAPNGHVFSESLRGYLTLTNPASAETTLVRTTIFADADIGPDVILNDKIRDIVWANDGRQLILQSDVELASFDLVDRKKHVLARYSQPVTNANWHPNAAYVFYQLGNSLHVIENNADAPNDIRLAELTRLDGSTIDSQAGFAYLAGTLGDQSGIFELALR